MHKQREIIINLHKSGKSNVALPKHLQINQSTVLKAIKHFVELKNTVDKAKSSYPRAVISDFLMFKAPNQK